MSDFFRKQEMNAANASPREQLIMKKAERFEHAQSVGFNPGRAANQVRYKPHTGAKQRAKAAKRVAKEQGDA